MKRIGLIVLLGGLLALSSTATADESPVYDATKDGATECGKLAAASVHGGELIENPDKLEKSIQKVAAYLTALKDMRSGLSKEDQKAIDGRIAECAEPLGKLLEGKEVKKAQ